MVAKYGDCCGGGDPMCSGGCLVQKAIAKCELSQPSAPVVPTFLRIKLRDAFAEVLGDAYDCTRVWSAWSVGTMTEDDFSPISESEDRLEEFVSAVLSVIQPTESRSLS
jgi:hypothetical protein